MLFYRCSDSRIHLQASATTTGLKTKYSNILCQKKKTGYKFDVDG
jgi:tRNA splicing ligase